MKRTLGILLITMMLLIGGSTITLAGDFELDLSYQSIDSDLSLGIDNLGELSGGGSGSAASFGMKYWFTPRWYLGADYTWGDYSHGILLSSDYNILNVEVGYLYPLTDKFSLGGILGYTSFDEDGYVIHPQLFNYDASVDGFTLGLKGVYKATEKFSISAGVSVMIDDDSSIDAVFLDDIYPLYPEIASSDAYYRQLVLEGRYQFNENWAVKAGYKRVWAGYEVNYTGSTVSHFDLDVDHVFDGLYLGVTYTF